jgi:F0F1-type ATP synthase assembly protein I
MMDLEKVQNFRNRRELVISTFYYISGSVFGPLLLFLGLGYFLDQAFHSKPKMLIVGFFVAFVVSNILLFKKAKRITKLIESYKLSESNRGDKEGVVIKK